MDQNEKTFYIEIKRNYLWTNLKHNEKKNKQTKHSKNISTSTIQQFTKKDVERKVSSSNIVVGFDYIIFIH